MPRGARHRSVMISRADSARVDVLSRRVGQERAARLLGVGPATLESARDQGSMLPSTLTRILAALDLLDQLDQVST